MEAEDEESDSPGAFTNKKPWKRIIVGNIINCYSRKIMKPIKSFWVFGAAAGRSGRTLSKLLRENRKKQRGGEAKEVLPVTGIRRMQF